MYTLPNVPQAVSQEVFAKLCATLPPPVTDTEETREVRDIAAMYAVASLHPADAFEALLAAQVIIADAYAWDCLRLATEHRDDLTKTLRCRAQACATMRQMQRALHTLHQMQAAREKAASASMPNESQRPQPAAPHSEETQAARDPVPPGPAPQPGKTQAARPPALPGLASQPDALSQAEAFAIENAVHAAQIRFDRGLTPANTARIDPAKLPNDPAVIEALVNGTSLILGVLDAIGGDRAELA
jgi:hypothetical protein